MSNLTAQEIKFIQGALDVQEVKTKAQLKSQGNYIEDALDLSYIDRIGNQMDYATEKNLIDVNNSFTDHLITELKSIAAARKRINQEDYGKCIDCNEPIGYRRLMACPTTERCITCQSLYEKTHMMKNFSFSRLSA